MNNKEVVGVVVDAGHGGSDPGAVSGNLREKDFTLQASLYMYDRLKDLGIPVVLTRDDDASLTRDQRINNALGAFGKNSDVILVSNHINAGGGEGAEVVYALRNDDTLAKSILENIGEAGQKMRKVYQRRLPEDPSKDYYYILRLTDPLESVLVEYGFIDNANDAAKLKSSLNNYAEGVVKAIASYLGVPYAPPGTTTPGGNTYTVQRGDTLYSIASKFNTTVDTLKSLNNLTSNTITIGQVLKLPGTTGNVYTVVAGDTLYSIAKRFNTTVDELKRLNNLTSDTLTIGQDLLVSSSTSGDIKDFITYTVKKGDSLWKIAQAYEITVQELIDFNRLNSTVLTIGQTLLIPVAGTLPPENSGTTQPTPNTYTVVAGDSLYSIAKKFNVTVDELKKANNLTNNLLTIGQVLTIPNGNNSNNQFIYTVVAGDSLWKIANANGITIEDIVNANNLTSTILSIGQQLIIPKNS